MVEFWFIDLILYVAVNKFSVMSRQVFLGWTSTKQGLMCLAQGHNTVPPVRLEPQTLDLKSSTLPLSHCAPEKWLKKTLTLCILASSKKVFWQTRHLYKVLLYCIQFFKKAQYLSVHLSQSIHFNSFVWMIMPVSVLRIP